MFRLRSVLLTVFVLCICLSAASPTDRQMYEAYLHEDMQVWGDYLSNASWRDADTEERRRILLYEYGYVPYLLSVGDTAGCRAANRRYGQHIESQKDVLPQAEYWSHSSATRIYSFVSSEGGIGDALKGRRLAGKAADADPLNPLALYMRANVYFHYPKLAGGNKKKALLNYLRAERIMERDSVYRYHWMYPAVQLVVAQCYEKTGESEKAVAQCRKILHLHPEFKYVKETYLPTLSDKKQDGKD